MMTTPNNSNDSPDDALTSEPEIDTSVQRLPIQASPQPQSTTKRCLTNSKYNHSLQQPVPVSMYKQATCNESLFRQSRCGISMTSAILAFTLGFGIYWSFENLQLLLDPPSNPEIGSVLEKTSGVNTNDSEQPAERSGDDLKAVSVTHSNLENVVPISDERVTASHFVFATGTSKIAKITDRIARMDDEFSRLKVDIADLRKSEELRNEMVTKYTAWTKAISTGLLVIRTSTDESIESSLPLVFVPAGQFWMGQTSAQRGESARASAAAHYDFSHPAHPVQITSGYFIGMYEVTIGQFQEFAAQYDTVGTVAAPLRYARETDLNKPACNIDWNTAVAFCTWLSKINNIEVRLPSEIEWEYAARGNMYVQTFESIREKELVMGGPWPVDNQNLDRSWCGCVAMNSNVQEWTIDIWDEKVYGKRDAMLKSSRPNSRFLYVGNELSAVSSSTEPRAVRGSSFQDIPANRVLAIRRFKPINAREETLGFRIVVPILNDESTGK